MKLKTDNPIPVKTRLKELLGDWLFILGYLIALFFTGYGLLQSGSRGHSCIH